MDATNASSPQGMGVLDRFSHAVRAWFLDAFEAPTPVQQKAWEAIESGENALVIAPTGSGKTLAAFLFAIDALMCEKATRDSASDSARPGKDRPASSPPSHQGEGGRSRKGVRVVYISPLKALGADVERNLQEPLAGIAERLEDEGAPAPRVRTGMRTGDTTAAQRRSLTRTPPDILITTPESLYLMLTSKAREGLRTVETLIVDEVHALVGNKRGSHLALSLERLDDLLECPAQRIGLSATVRPREEVARFLGGPHPVRVVAAEQKPDMDVRVIVPVPDMTDIPAYRGSDADGAFATKRDGHGGGSHRAPIEEAWKSDRALRAAMAKPNVHVPTPDDRVGSSSIWPFIEESILDEVLSHRTTIVFVNSRGLCEKLTARINELYVQRCTVVPKRDVFDADAAPSHLRSDLGPTTGLSQGVSSVIAKAHHGSISKEKRLQVEHELKTGRLPCVVATSSLELGIDMGSIDLVLQVAAPPSVASGLQRIGRANHQVGGRSEGAIYPRTRTEIIDAAVVAEGMRKGLIEETSYIRNALDVLAQQTVAVVAMGEVEADAWFETARRAAPFTELPRRAFDSVLDMLAGRHASTDLAEFSPRIIWDRERGVLVPRPGTQRQAVTAAGTIPDRGLFSVVLPQGEGNEGRRRVGELDEEMVYESRVGDIIALGTNSWRIREITRDRVIVEPAPGRSARLPFWHGEGVGRPAETGRARGEFLRAVAGGIEHGQTGLSADAAVRARLDADGLDADAQKNLVELIHIQREVTGVVPDDRTLVVERCEDEAGDWRVMLHSPYGRRVHEPWAMAVSDRVMHKWGFDSQAMAADDGIVLRIPMTQTRLPGAELFVFDSHELDRIVRDRVDSTALFAARFRECAARALLMSPAAPGKRAPLWQQRLKAGQLLEAARRERDFPILLETARECLQDVYDMQALHMLMEGLQAGVVHIFEVQTTVPSPFAAPMLFGYVGEHLYQSDLPHAERRASLLSLDPTLLGELLGTADMAELLDPDVVLSVEESLQRIAPGRRVRGVEGIADVLRVLGPLSAEEVARRLRSMGEHGHELAEPYESIGDDGAFEPDEPPAPCATVTEALIALAELHDAHRVFSTMIGGEERWASVDDAGRLRDALGVKVPPWLPPSLLEEKVVADRTPLDDLVGRYARTHGPFSTEAVAERFGIGSALARESLERLLGAGRIMRGRFGRAEGEGALRLWVSTDVFGRLRSLSLAKVRKQVRAVDGAAFVRFLFDLQGLGPIGGERLEGIEGTAQVIAQFEGVFLPASSWEDHVLPARVRDFCPSMLDELLASGEVVWAGSRRGGAGEETAGGLVQGRFAQRADTAVLIAFYPTDSPLAPVQPDPSDDPSDVAVPEPGGTDPDATTVPEMASGSDRSSIEAALIGVLGFGGGLFFRQILDAVRHRLAPEVVDQAAVAAALQELALSGRATNDTFAPIRAMGAVTGSRSRSASRRRVSSRRSRLRYDEVNPTAQTSASGRFSGEGIGSAVLSGRWSLLAPSPVNDTVRAIAMVESILDRYGLLTRDVVAHSGVPGGMAALFPVLRSMEDAGDVVRGTFVEGFGPAQFAARETIDLLRTYAVDTHGHGASDEGSTSDEHPSRSDRASSSGTVVLAADDPACLFGAGIPWPPVVDGDHADGPTAADTVQMIRPTRRPGSLVVVRDGAPVLYAAAQLRSILAFADDDEVLFDAARALIAYVTRAAKREGAVGARKKIVVETFNGLPVLSMPFADILRASGLVALPDGMRLYVSPF